VKLRASTPDRIARAFSDAVAAGELEAAEGWLVLAAYAEARRPASRRGRRERRGDAPRLLRLPEPAA
jgi:hypothetical protein